MELGWKAAAAACCISGCFSSANVGNKPHDDAGGSASESTGDTNVDTTTTTGDSAEDTTSDDTTTGEPAAPGRCARHDAGPGEWVFHCGSLAYDNVVGAGTDDEGNVYFAIEWRALDEAAGSTLEIGDETITNDDLSDTVLVKLDTDGNVVWTRHFGGEGDQYAEGLTTCADRLIVSGSAEPGTLDLGGGVLPHEHWVAAFDRDGQHIWSRSFEVAQPDGWMNVYDMACDESGNAIIGGGFRDGLDLGDGMIAGGVQDTYLAKLDTTGALVWKRGGGGTDYTVGYGTIALAPGGDIVVGGSFASSIDLGGGPLDADGDDAFVARYGADGTYLWGVQIGPDSLQYAGGVAVADDGTIALTGTFLYDVEVAGETFHNVLPEQNEEEYGTCYDVFVATLDASGAWGWAAHEGTMLDDQTQGETFTPDGELLVLGSSTEGLRLDRYADGTRTTVRELTDTVWWRGTLQATDGDRVLVANNVTSIGTFDYAGVTLEGQGAFDTVIAKLSH